MQDGPWTLTDAAVLLVAEAAGLAAILVAWYGTSGQFTPNRQTAWVAGGVAGIILAGAGNATWLIRARRRIGQRRTRALLRPTEGYLEQHRARPVDSALVVCVPGGGRYHRAACALVTGKAVVAATPEQHISDGRQPCGVCAP
jgi:hypothetical protein